VRDVARRILGAQEIGLVLVLVAVTVLLTLLAGSHPDRRTGELVNNFWNSYTLIQTATDASFFAIMAIGATMVIISGGIDLSVGSIYALSGVAMALLLRHAGPMGSAATVGLGLTICVGVGVLCGVLNGALVTGLKVHPFIITLGTMWMLRGIAFVTSKAESILVPQPLTSVAKASRSKHPVPVALLVTGIPRLLEWAV
jgi:ribose/xylose/arabinose/galactoside ABC-type transport system permease subunit